MSKPSAEVLSRAGDQFIGRKYEEIDCQEFIERCLREVGITLNLKGSNAWFRKMTWTGTPEECKKKFGSIPKGGFLFIHAFDGGEVKRGYTDGKGNASHIGMKTGRGKGAIHSSQSRGCVCESDFHDKTIRGGGWNTVGLWNALDYGEKINNILAGKTNASGSTGGGQAAGKESDVRLQGTIQAPDGGRVNLRAKPSTATGAILYKIPTGNQVDILEESGKWYRVEDDEGHTGWVMKEFVVSGGSDASAGEGDVTLTIPAAKAQVLLPILENMVDQLVSTIGRG